MRLLMVSSDQTCEEHDRDDVYRPVFRAICDTPTTTPLDVLL